MMRNFLLIVLTIFFIADAQAQSRAYGIKFGPSIGVQKWDGFNSRDPLFAYHAAAFIESVPEESQFALFAQAGFHVRGSAIRRFAGVYTTTNGEEREFAADTDRFEFRNIALVLGGKRKYDFGANKIAYYSLGLRGEYTIGTNLDQYSEVNRFYLTYPVDEFVREFNYGVTIGGGFEFPMSEYIGVIVELSASPDFSKQYNQPPIVNVPIPNQPGQSRTIPERQISNISLELSVGFRFLHKIEYIDEE